MPARPISSWDRRGNGEHRGGAQFCHGSTWAGSGSLYLPKVPTGTAYRRGVHLQ